MAAIASGHGRRKWIGVLMLAALVGSLAGRPVVTATAAAGPPVAPCTLPSLSVTWNTTG